MEIASVGKWEDDYTFVAQSTGYDERSWLDNAGRPHSDALRVESDTSAWITTIC